MSSFTNGNSSGPDHSDESHMWVKAEDGTQTLYFPMATSKIRYDGSGALGYCQLEQGAYAVKPDGSQVGSSSKFYFQDAEIIKYSDVP